MFYIILLSLLLANAPLFSAKLVSADRSARPAETISTSIFLVSDGQLLSGLQFDVECDKGLSIQAVPGIQMATSSKWLLKGTPRPGVLRILIAGMNRTAIPDGELVRLFVNAAPDTVLSELRITISNPVGTSPESSPAALTASPIRIYMEGGTPTGPVPPGGVLNAASLQPGAISAGEIITVFGSFTSTNPMLLFNGLPASILYAGMNQINAVVPPGLAPEGTATMKVVQDSSRGELALRLAPASPAIFTVPAGGTGQGAILNQDYSLNSDLSPAAPGSVVMVYGTGFGALHSPLVPTTVAPVTAMIDGIAAEVTYAGAAPSGPMFGLIQINVRIPQTPGPNLQAPLFLSVGGRSTPPGVSIAIR